MSCSSTWSDGFAHVPLTQVSQPLQQLWRGDPVDHRRGGAAALHETRVKQHLQVLRSRGLSSACGFSNLPNRLLTPAEYIEDAHARAIAECARPGGDELNLFA